MIASLSGIVKSLSLTSAVVEVGGVGITVQVSGKFASNLQIGKKCEVFTSLVVRQDALTLFGFESLAAKDFFELLQTVSGIGPKVSQSALSIFEPEELIAAISNGENKSLEKIPGLGKKGASRLILELKDKVAATKINSASWRAPIESALSGLGYSAKEANEILDKLSKEQGKDISRISQSELLKLALQLGGAR